jgi:hypothetical protein
MDAPFLNFECRINFSRITRLKLKINAFLDAVPLVWQTFNDISEEHDASIFRVENNCHTSKLCLPNGPKLLRKNDGTHLGTWFDKADDGKSRIIPGETGVKHKAMLYPS